MGIISLRDIAVISQNLDYIAEGRIFLLNIPHLDGEPAIPTLKPPMQGAITIQYDGAAVEILGPVSEETPLSCSECEVLYERTLVFHTDEWMCCIFSCSAHPLRAWIDLFPKYMSGTESDWTNAFKGFDVSIALPEGVEIKGRQTPEEHYLTMRRVIKPTYRLTPDGVKKI